MSTMPPKHAFFTTMGKSHDRRRVADVEMYLNPGKVATYNVMKLGRAGTALAGEM